MATLAIVLNLLYIENQLELNKSMTQEFRTYSK